MIDWFRKNLTFRIIGTFLVVFLLLELSIGYVSVRQMRNRMESLKEEMLSEDQNDSVAVIQESADQKLDQMVGTYRNNIILAVLLLSLAGTATLYGILKIWVLQPIRQIQRQNRKTTDFEEMEIIPEENIPPDEIGELIRSRNQMLNELKESRERLKQFIYGASHDLRAPLRRIRTYSEFLESDLFKGDHESAEEDLEYIGDSVDKMSDLLEGLLRLSRIGSNGLEIKSVDLEEIVDAALENCLDEDRKEIVNIDRDPLPQLKGDSSLLVELYQNLISNAIKHADPEHSRVMLTARQEHDTVILGVKDNGKGVPEGAADDIFHPFETAHTEEEGSGSGLGLAICRKIVQEHNGKIWVENEEGEGAHFQFVLWDDLHKKKI